ncbi:MAG TPA: hypothetical protein VL948_08935 [Verrucomicrobiae bacterium]|nr:hypothetical protein [Verrucomicrobiae bacterium]
MADLRRWPGVVERSRAVFYARRQPLLHFHLTREGARRADVRGRDGWTSLELPTPITAASRRALRRLVEARYREREPARRSAARR